MSEMPTGGVLKIGSRTIPYQLKRSARNGSVRLAMTMDGFDVLAPHSANAKDVELALLKKKKWIIENYDDLQKKYQESHKIARFKTGAKLPYWGRLVRLNTQLTESASPKVYYENGIRIEHPAYSSVKTHDNAVEAAIHEYLTARVSVELKSLVKRYSASLDVQPKTVRVREMKERWGSCSKAGNISIDWRLVYAPKRVLAYVVAHELTHLRINDHSPRFWSLLKKVYGHFEPEHSWLMGNEHLLGYKKLLVRDDSI
ncbi:hypothetical protein IDSA_11480 [Pseudidiomarina salinarum]|uniref:YgjP-like metallopeptidase domain-containing protein n=1 Tax=Pseudidiomarina salinarum TaxID=435908 RepID=A0A094JC72_9GAMM|nr:SprT family zinc-dependent metalloprotease [Pseudidiomarina salinarum]KFZ30176.1 hypothetical protein IDSA_11480 [Pseudidiomarina salinarum]RUO68678.1 M48 family peptidase [Pseudidiomarina salinarum]